MVEIIIIYWVIIRYKVFLIKWPVSIYIYKCIALSHTAKHCTVVKKEKLNKLISENERNIYILYILLTVSLKS